MRIKCLHGFFIFEEQACGQLSRFISMTGLAIVPYGKQYTFETLSNAKKYSIAGNEYLGAIATKTFEGEPWEVMRENKFVYDFNKDQLIDIETVSQNFTMKQSNNYLISNGLILPGSLMEGGQRVKEYSAWYLFDSAKFRYSEVLFE